MSNSPKKAILLFIIVVGFLLRFHAATTIPLGWDEETWFAQTPAICLKGDNLRLPLFLKALPHNLMTLYLIKLGYLLSGSESALAGRFLFVVFGTATLLIFYLFIKYGFGRNIALIATVIMALSKYHIGYSRIADVDILFIFFSLISLYYFYRGLKEDKTKFIFLFALFIGIGFYALEKILIVILFGFVFILFSPDYRCWLRRREYYLAHLIIIILLLPFLIWNLIHSLHHINYIKAETVPGFSLRGIGFFLAEPLLKLSHSTNIGKTLINSTDYEYPFVFWLLGLLAIGAFFYGLKRYAREKGDFLKFLLFIFAGNVIIFSLFRRIDEFSHSTSFFELGSLDWCILALIPAIGLIAFTFFNIFQYNKNLFCLVFLFFIVLQARNTIAFINFPLNCFIPLKGYAVGEWYGLVNKYYLPQDPDKALDILRRIYNVADKDSPYKKKTALVINEILQSKAEHQNQKRLKIDK